MQTGVTKAERFFSDLQFMIDLFFAQESNFSHISSQVHCFIHRHCNYDSVASTHIASSSHSDELPLRTDGILMITHVWSTMMVNH